MPSCSNSLTENHSLEVDKEKQMESPLPESTNGDQQCIKNSGGVNGEKKTLPADQVGTAKTEGKQNFEKEKLVDVDTKRLGVSAGTGSSLTPAGQSGTNSRPVPAPRRAKARQQEPSTSNPLWPPPKSHPVKVMKRSMSESELVIVSCLLSASSVTSYMFLMFAFSFAFFSCLFQIMKTSQY